MKRRKPLLTEAERLRIQQATCEAEARTSVEIVPALAAASGRYDRAEDAVGLWAGIALAGAVWYFVQGVSEGSGWSSTPEVRLGFWPLAGLLVAGFIGGAVAAARWTWLRRLFTPRREMQQEVIARAKAVFFDTRSHRDAPAGGVLIYVSLFERTVTVLGDEVVRERLSERSLEEVRDEVIRGIREGSVVEGILNGIRRAGQLLETALPAVDTGRKHGGNELIVLE